jgi:hypothetical protein
MSRGPDQSCHPIGEHASLGGMSSFANTRTRASELPEVDDRLVAPGARYEIEDGRVVYVPPVDGPHSERHGRLAVLAQAHCAAGFGTAISMLTRTSPLDDFAPDISVYPIARDPRTGGRLLEALAFLIARTGALAGAGTRAAKLVARGVRRVLAIDVERVLALEWSKEPGEWAILERGGSIEDPALAVPIPIEALLDASRAGDAIAAAYRARRQAVAEEEREEEQEEEREEERAEGAAEEGRAEE